MGLEMAALTHKGQVRTHNEDSLYFDQSERFAIICDGMGGHAGGQVASEIAVQVVTNGMRRLTTDDWEDEEAIIEATKEAIFSANDHILSRARIDPSLFDMGTTIVACAFMDDRVITANVGDSRIYRVADNQIEQVSEDHSLVAEKIRLGELRAGSAEAKMLSNILTRALGMDQITVDITVEDLCPGDVYLMCTDGLSDVIEDSEMRDVVLGTSDLQLGCVRLVDLANQRGGPDNVTVALIRYE